MFDGYFSLEAAILVPLTFFLFVLVIHLAFYYYGRCLAVQDSYLIALRGGLLRDGEDRVSFMYGNASWQFGEKYFGNGTPQADCTAVKDEVRVSAETETNRSAFDLVPSDPWTYTGSAAAMDINIPLRIRKAQRIADIAQMGLRYVKEKTGGQNGH